MKKFLSTKILMLVSCMAMMLAFSNQAFSQEEDGKVYFGTVFEVRDAVGNIDTCIFIVKEGATRGIDTVLGEVNLYGQEPTKDLDLRIIQRTTINCTENERNYWLCNVEPSSSENIDLKVDYRFDASMGNHWGGCYYFLVLKLYAKHYPASIYLIENDYYGFNYFALAQFSEEDGMYVEGTHENFDFSIPKLLHTFNDASENNLLRIHLEFYTSIDDAFYEQPTLYPNPASEFITIEDGRIGETFTISDINGKTVKTFTVENYPYSVDIRELQRGTYFLKNREGTIIYSFIKQ